MGPNSKKKAFFCHRDPRKVIYKCKRCDYKSKSKQNVIRHQGKSVPCDYICKDCGIRNKDYNAWYNHYKRKGGCITIIRDRKTKRKRWKCPKCPKSFPQRQGFETHWTKPVPCNFKCGTCSKRCLTYQNWYNHSKRNGGCDDNKITKITKIA